MKSQYTHIIYLYLQLYMGIQQSKQKKLPYSRQYGYHLVLNDIVVKQYELTSPQEQMSFKTLVTMYRSFDVPTILPIIQGKQFFNQNGIAFGWRLKFKYLNKTLQQEIDQYKLSNRRYTEEQLLKAIDCILSALMGFKLKKLTHGCLNCHAIFVNYHSQKLFQPQNKAQFDESQKIYTIGLPLLLNNSQLQKLVNQNRLNQLYLTQLALSQIQQGKPKPTTNQKGDVFSLGLVTLKMASLGDVTEIYDYENYRLKDEVLERKIFQCRKNYSQKLCNMIQRMLNRSDKSRPDLQEIFNQFSSISSYTNQNQQNQQSFQLNFNKLQSKTPSNKKITPVKDIIDSSHKISISQFGSTLNLKSISKSKQKQSGIKPNYLWVQSEQLGEKFHVSKQSQRAWDKFKKRMDNKVQIKTFRNNLF